MKQTIFATLFGVLFAAQSYAAMWTHAVPKEIHLVPGGMVLIGDFDRSGVLCATGPRAIFLPRLDPMFKEKLTLALAAKSANKEIRAQIGDPIESSCVNVASTGKIPVVSPYFWQLAD